MAPNLNLKCPLKIFSNSSGIVAAHECDWLAHLVDKVPGPAVILFSPEFPLTSLIPGSALSQLSLPVTSELEMAQ